MFGRIRAALATTVLVALAVPLTAPAAHADPVPAPYTGSTHGDILTTDLSVLSGLLGAAVLTADLAHSATAVDSEATPRSHAESANLDAGAIGIPIAVDSLSADGPSGAYDDTLLDVDVPPLLDTGVISGIGEANWAGDAACVTPGTPIAASSTELAGATVGGLTIPLSDVPLSILPDLGLTLATLDTVTTTGTVMLSPNGATNDVVATTTATAAAATLLNGRVTVDVAAPELTVTSTGADGTIAYNNPLVSVTADLDGDTVFEIDTTLQAEGGSLPLTVTLVDDAVVGTLTAAVTLDLAPDPSGATGVAATASVPAVVSVDVSLSATGALALLLGDDLVTLGLGLLPLTASATAPAGGVQCELPPPVITAPLTGDLTTSTPTVTGTAEPGATVHVTIDGATHDVVADGTGAWSLVWPDELSPGDHTVVATQTVDGTTSGSSNDETFTVVTPPVIVAPASESSTADTTPTIEGTGHPGASIEVLVDGTSIGTVVVAVDGTWSLTPTDAIGFGEHGAEAVQTIDGIVLQAAPVIFFVRLPAPVITSPEDGSETTDTTPDIEGTGVPGQMVVVTVDGAVVLGPVDVGDDGRWTVTPTDALACGEHTAVARQFSGVGGAVTSPDSEPVTFTVICPAPAGGSADGDVLPKTGAAAGTGSLALLAIVLILGGAGLAMVGGGLWSPRRRSAYGPA